MQILLTGLPYAIAAMVAAPLVVVVSTLIMSSAQRPAPSVLLFVLGAALLDLPIAAIVLVGFGPANTATGGKGLGPWIDVVVGLAFVALGIHAMREQEGEEQETKLRTRAQQIATSGAVGLVSAGMLAQVINIDAIVIMTGGMKEIASVSPPGTWTTAVLVLVVFSSSCWPPTICRSPCTRSRLAKLGTS